MRRARGRMGRAWASAEGTAGHAYNAGGSFFCAIFGKIRPKRRKKGAESVEQRAAAEQRYITGSMALRDLAQSMGVPFSTISRWCKEGEWVKKREQINKKALQKAAGQAVNKKAREMAKLLEASDELEETLLKAAQAFRNAMAGENGMDALLVDGKFRAGNLAQIVNAVGRQAETRMLIGGMMTAADKAKIQLMRRKQRLEEKQMADGAAGGEVRVVMDKEAEALSE